MRQGEFGLKLERLLKQVASLLELAVFLVQPAQIVVGQGPGRIEPEHFLVDFDRLGVAVLVGECVCEVLQEEVGIGLELGRTLEPGQRFVDPAFPMQRQTEVGMDLCQIGFQPEGLEITRARLGVLLHRPVHVREIVVGLGKIGLEVHRRLAMRQGLIGMAAVEQKLAEVGAGLRQVGIECDGTLEMFHGLVGLSQTAIDRADIRMGHCVVGTQGESSLEMLDRLVASAQGLQRQGEVIVRLGIVFPELQGSPAASHGALELAGRPVGFGQVGMESGHTGAKSDGLADELDRLGRLALLVKDHAQKMSGVGVVGVPDKYSLISARRCDELSRLMMTKRLDHLRLHVTIRQRPFHAQNLGDDGANREACPNWKNPPVNGTNLQPANSITCEVGFAPAPRLLTSEGTDRAGSMVDGSCP